VGGQVFICKFNSHAFTFFQTMSLALNFCLCHDLIKTLKDPFYPGKRRMKWYFYGSFGVSIVVAFLTNNTLDYQCTTNTNIALLKQQEYSLLSSASD
jgi:hypothetical protein